MKSKRPTRPPLPAKGPCTVGDLACQAAVFVYKADGTEEEAWHHILDLKDREGPVRGERRTQKRSLLAGLKAWNEATEGANFFLCIYSHAGPTGVNAIGGDATRRVTWEQLANALPLGVNYLWLASCNSKCCLKAWSPLCSPVKHRLLATLVGRKWVDLLPLVALEIGLDPIVEDVRMRKAIQRAAPQVAPHVKYFRPTPKGFVPV